MSDTWLPLLDDLEFVHAESVVVAALIEMDNDVQLRHRGRLLRRTGNDADVALAGMQEEVRAVRAEGVRLQFDRCAMFDDIPSPTAARVSHASHLSPRDAI